MPKKVKQQQAIEAELTGVDHRRIRMFNKNNYTVVMKTADNLADIVKVMDKFELRDGYYVYKNAASGEFSLINGKYKKRKDAIWAKSLLPSIMKKWSPRIVTFAEIQSTI